MLCFIAETNCKLEVTDIDLFFCFEVITETDYKVDEGNPVNLGLRRGDGR